MDSSKNKAVMQIHLDHADSEDIVGDLKEYAAALCPALGYNTSVILEEMANGDDEHLIGVFQKYFGDYVELLNADNMVISRKKLSL